MVSTATTTRSVISKRSCSAYLGGTSAPLAQTSMSLGRDGAEKGGIQQLEALLGNKGEEWVLDRAGHCSPGGALLGQMGAGRVHGGAGLGSLGRNGCCTVDGDRHG